MTAAPVIHVSQHAIDRYFDRIGAKTEDEARAALQSPAVALAGAFGARVVKLARGRIILRLAETGIEVITVVPLEQLPIQLVPQDRGGPPPISVDRAWPPRKEMR